VGHLSGILAGYCLAIGLFSWLTPGWTLSLLLWAALGLGYAAARSQQISIPYIRLPGGAAGFGLSGSGSGSGGGGCDLEGGSGSVGGLRAGGTRIVNGEIVRG
jgi:hypothetical protein